MDDIARLYRDGRRAAAWGIAISLALGTAKALGGWSGHSFALLTDAVHSLVDALISAALLVAFAIAQRPADREHPYGHARAEAVVGQGVALVLIALAMGIGWEAATTLGHRHREPEAFVMAIAAGGAIVQEGLYRYVVRVARRAGSGALLATAWDYRLDALGSLAVLVGVALARWGGPAWTSADRAAGLAVAVTILRVGLGLLWDNTQGLMDRQAEPERLEEVRLVALAVDGVVGVETIRVRKAGLEQLVDIHVEVDPSMTVREGHDIAHAVKARLIARVGPIRDVLVHVEPASAAPAPDRAD